ncbi:hypothetical protein [Streptomyces sp. ERV7]|nr:hypothetical protein [Streptomyces sp. ERV7]
MSDVAPVSAQQAGRAIGEQSDHCGRAAGFGDGFRLLGVVAPG